MKKRQPDGAHLNSGSPFGGYLSAELGAHIGILLSTLPVCFYRCRAEGDFGMTYISASIKDLTGYESEYFISAPSVWTDHVHTDDREKLLQELSRISGESTYEHEYRFRISDGSYAWFLGRSRIEASAPAGFRQIVGVILDVTGRKHAEEELLNVYNLAKKYLETAGVIMIVIDAEEKVSLINRKGSEVLGYPEEEIVGSNWFDRFVPDFCREEAREVFRALISGEESGFGYSENAVFAKSGEERLIAWNNTVLRDGEGRIVATLSSGEDITDRRRAEIATKASEERFKVLFELAPDAYFLSDMEGRILDGNAVAGRLIGYEWEEAIGKRFIDLGLLSPEQKSKAASLLSRNIEGQPTGPDEFELHRNDGSTVTVEIVSHPIKLGGRNAIFGVARDITLRRKGERELKAAYEKLKITQAELIQAEKMSAIGRFSSGVAHEVKNPLGVILSGAEFLELKLSRSDADVAAAVQKIKEASLRANFALQTILQFARPSEQKTEEVRPADIVTPVISMISSRASRARIGIETELGDEFIKVNVDKNQLQQVVFNIVKNAIEAIDEDGKITIRAYGITDAEIFDGNPACIIQISDTGPGIPKEIMARITEPFFTTKAEIKGTGLGLYISKTIVENHKGKLLFESPAGSGATVKIILPLADN